MNDQADLGVAAHWIYKEKVDKNEGKQYKGIRQILDILDQSKEQRVFRTHKITNVCSSGFRLYTKWRFNFSSKRCNAS